MFECSRCEGEFSKEEINYIEVERGDSLNISIAIAVYHSEDTEGLNDELLRSELKRLLRGEIPDIAGFEVSDFNLKKVGRNISFTDDDEDFIQTVLVEGASECYKTAFVCDADLEDGDKKIW